MAMGLCGTSKHRKKCRRCPRGSRAICKGGFRKGGRGRKRVCRKFVCRRRK